MREHYDGWQKSSHHANATCNGCHTPTNLISKYLSKANNGFWHSKGFTFYDYHEPIRIRESNRKILLENCVNCHEKFVAEIHQGNGDKSQLNCIHCHATVGHGPTK
jgi:cytochrome c nitrite reductase small subunit